MKRWIVAAAMAALGGCMDDIPLTVLPHPSDPERLLAQVPATDNVTLMDSAERRGELIVGRLRRQCGEPVIEETRVTPGGTVGFFRAPTRLYTMTVRCPGGATRPVER